MEFSVSNANIYHHNNLLLLPSWGWSGGKLLLAGGNSELCSVSETTGKPQNHLVLSIYFSISI